MLPEFHVPEPQLGNSLKAVSWVNHVAHIIYFPYSRTLCHGFLYLFHIFYLVVVVLRRRVNLIIVTLYCAEAKLHLINIEISTLPF